MNLRLEGIMSANRWNYYVEWAAYVAGLAEEKASRSEVSGKQGVLQADSAMSISVRLFSNAIAKNVATSADFAQSAWALCAVVASNIV